MIPLIVLLLIGAGIYLLLRKKEQLPPRVTFSEVDNAADGQRRMADHVFWGIIDRTRSNAGGDYGQQKKLLTDGLRQLEPEQILLFDNSFRYYRGQLHQGKLWAAARIVKPDCSDDCFSDFRGWLIGQGRKTMNQVLADPEFLLTLDLDSLTDWEGLSYCALIAYQDKTGDEMPMGLRENVDLQGEWLPDEVLQSKFPRLWAYFRQANMHNS